MNRDEIEGRKDQLKGKVKKAVGDLTDNERLHDEGVVDEAAGDVKEGFGRGRRKVGEAVDDLADKIKR
ncbi:MAG: CsbD family protein [Acidobacteria bacterium]|nr:CsbD family protein [Acidobacteriota bacterium]